MTDDLPTTLHTDVVQRDGAMILSVRGDLDLRSTPSLVRSVQTALASADVRSLTIDVAEVGFCDSSGLTGFVQIRQHCAETDRAFSLDGVQLSLLRLLELTGLRDYLNVVSDAPES